MPDYGNRQSLNRYACALNSPLRYVDPTGHRVVADDESPLRGSPPVGGVPSQPSKPAGSLAGTLESPGSGQPAGGGQKGLAVSVDVAAVGDPDDAAHQQLANLATSLDYLDLGLTGGFALTVGLAGLAGGGPAGLVVAEGAYQPVSVVTNILDAVGWAATAVADRRANRSVLLMGDNFMEARLGVDTLVSTATMVSGFLLREMWVSTLVDAAQVYYDTRRYHGLEGHSLRVRVNW